MAKRKTSTFQRVTDGRLNRKQRLELRRGWLHPMSWSGAARYWDASTTREIQTLPICTFISSKLAP